MALNINTNIGALGAAAAAASVNKSMESAMGRLSTGLRINTAADDAAGVAIASRLTSEIRGTNQAIRNAMDGQALIDTAEGAHNEIVNILQRMRELAVQSANDTNDATDRTNLQAEFQALTNEIDRIAAVTTWAGQSLLTGSGGNNTNGTFNLQVGGNTNAADTITVTINAMTTAELKLGQVTAADEVVEVKAATAGDKVEITAPIAPSVTQHGGTVANTNELTMVVPSDATPGNHADSTFTFKAGGKDVSVALLAADTAAQAATKVAAAAELADTNLTATVDGAKITFTIKADVAAVAGKAAVSAADASSVSTRDTATAAITRLDDAIASVNTQRAELGAVSNRLDSTVNNLTNISTNLEAGRSRIQDADFAAESTNLAKSQILQQASMAMLAQANASKQGVLSLLQR